MDKESSTAIIQLCQDLLNHKNRDTKLLFIALIISLCVNIFIVVSFLWYESQWDITDTSKTVTEQVVDGDSSSIVNGDQYNDKSQNNSEVIQCQQSKK